MTVIAYFIIVTIIRLLLLFICKNFFYLFIIFFFMWMYYCARGRQRVHWLMVELRGEGKIRIVGPIRPIPASNERSGRLAFRSIGNRTFYDRECD